ncbi:hypothetical protein [Halorubrum sp. CBA1229]|uniref:hypothetical protein n=1 Tax=Halorubrum sp. CBA1229 TaxID=1853699 RepID=UPI0011CDCED6|nr:hypothetical protein [Halorubrum sp. CBA1229]QKY17736.1 hypothetical protein Hrr1229_012875 [Halorubrum sp. CBA1229]
MKWTQALDRIVLVYPVVLISVVSFLITGVIQATLPIAELQILFWGILGIGLLGDSITTGCLGKFDLNEQERGYTRWACGAEPTLLCAGGTRVLLFVAILIPYLLIFRYGLFREYYIIQLTGLLTPVAFGLMAVGATLVNSYAMWRHRGRTAI